MKLTLQLIVVVPESPEVTFLGTDTSFAQSHPPLLGKYLVEGNCSS